jgi:hypothetical protein
MDSILKSFTVGFLLRNLFAGVFFVISYYLASHKPSELAEIDGKTVLTLVLPVALFVGVITYGIHRSLFYPFFECFLFDSKCGRECRRMNPCIKLATIRTLAWRWDQGTDASKVDHKRVNQCLDTWADLVHLQYTSAFCIPFGSVVGWLIVPGAHPPCCSLIIFAGLLLCCGFVSDWRLHSVLDYFRKE